MTTRRTNEWDWKVMREKGEKKLKIIKEKRYGNIFSLETQRHFRILRDSFAASCNTSRPLCYASHTDHPGQLQFKIRY
jgi:hypothetical protein